MTTYESGTGGMPRHRDFAERMWPTVVAAERLLYRVLALCWAIEETGRDKAAEAYRKALELGKNYALVHYKIGLLWEETKPAEAIKAFEKYLASDKNPDFQTEAIAKIEKLKNVTAPQSQGKQ